MLAVNYTNLRDNMKRYMDQVTDDYETMIVTRKNNKNVVILKKYKELRKSLSGDLPDKGFLFFAGTVCEGEVVGQI